MKLSEFMAVNNNKAFTLIELIISMMIIAIIAGVSIPGIVAYQNKQLEDQFVNQLINQMRSLENISLTKDINTKLSYDQNNGIVSFCEVEQTNCKTLLVPSPVLTLQTFTIPTLYFDKYANTLDSNKNQLAQESVIETNLYKIHINNYGGIYKETKNQ